LRHFVTRAGCTRIWDILITIIIIVWKWAQHFESVWTYGGLSHFFAGPVKGAAEFDFRDAATFCQLSPSGGFVFLIQNP